MNVIITNRYKSMIQNLEIDIIKEMNGEFEVDEIISSFQNFFFQRMILDITAIKDYKNIKKLQKLSISLDMDKVILLLDDTAESSSKEYQSNLISIGIYNFTRNVEGIMYLYNNPNNYRDVAHIHQLAEITEEGSMPNFIVPVHGLRILGVKNITAQSGATTLIYMMKKQLQKNYRVAAFEVNRRDFTFFNDKELISTNDASINSVISKHSDYDVILIDINDSAIAEGMCHDIIYLIEPSVVKLNKFMMVNSKKLDKLKNKKVILNQSMLSSKDVLDFEYESRLKIFFNMPPLDERQTDIHILNAFLTRLGFDRQKTEEIEKKNKILGLFNI
ncbi:MAG: hypothetical protein PHW32_02165 [Bacilli bacterium]|nr:hypothetical protein [Bacilli bacterium]MDD4282292.1 hypothetical protein [Bacilli bacterium]MDD4718775.1 hypothetical protein [Bacilli bacterium]